MTERERWTVYPLLFLALGVGLRGNFSPTHLIRCHRLSIQPPDGKGGVDLLAAPTGGVIQLTGANGSHKSCSNQPPRAECS